MTDNPAPTADSLARDLVDLVTRANAPRLTLLEDRIVAALVYMKGVSVPTVITLTLIEEFLTGERDDFLAFHNAADQAHEIRKNLT